MTIDFKGYAEQAIREAWEHGPPQPDESEPVCQTCGGAWYVRREIVQTDNDRQYHAVPCPSCNLPLEERLAKAGVTKGWATWNNTEATAEALAALAQLHAGVRWSVTLKGGYGIGKTHLAMACAESFVRDGKSAKVVNVPEFLGELRKAIDEQDDSIDLKRERFNLCDLLVLDDYGAERRSDWTTEQLYMVVDERYRRQAPLIVTTNVALTDKRVMSRLGPGLVEIKSADMRKVYER